MSGPLGPLVATAILASLLWAALGLGARLLGVAP